MFRRTGKNPLEKEIATPLYSDDHSMRYGVKKPEAPEPYIPERASPLPHFQNTAKEEPETTLGEGVTFRGELTFERLLRIDGTFEGELISKGKVIVGPKGKVKANLTLREAIIEGTIDGNITVEERLELRGEASVTGDIIAKFLSVDEGVSLCGNVTVTAQK